MFYRMYLVEEKEEPGLKESIEHPALSQLRAPPGATYHLLDDDGLPLPGYKVPPPPP
jgi:hypothetical protein